MDSFDQQQAPTNAGQEQAASQAMDSIPYPTYHNQQPQMPFHNQQQQMQLRPFHRMPQRMSYPYRPAMYAPGQGQGGFEGGSDQAAPSLSQQPHFRPQYAGNHSHIQNQNQYQYQTRTEESTNFQSLSWNNNRAVRFAQPRMSQFDSSSASSSTSNSHSIRAPTPTPMIQRSYGGGGNDSSSRRLTTAVAAAPSNPQQFTFQNRPPEAMFPIVDRLTAFFVNMIENSKLKPNSVISEKKTRYYIHRLIQGELTVYEFICGLADVFPTLRQQSSLAGFLSSTVPRMVELARERVYFQQFLLSAQEAERLSCFDNPVSHPRPTTTTPAPAPTLAPRSELQGPRYRPTSLGHRVPPETPASTSRSVYLSSPLVGTPTMSSSLPGAGFKLHFESGGVTDSTTVNQPPLHLRQPIEPPPSRASAGLPPISTLTRRAEGEPTRTPDTPRPAYRLRPPAPFRPVLFPKFTPIPSASTDPRPALPAPEPVSSSPEPPPPLLNAASSPNSPRQTDPDPDPDPDPEPVAAAVAEVGVEAEAEVEAPSEPPHLPPASPLSSPTPSKPPPTRQPDRMHRNLLEDMIGQFTSEGLTFDEEFYTAVCDAVENKLHRTLLSATHRADIKRDLDLRRAQKRARLAESSPNDPVQQTSPKSPSSADDVKVTASEVTSVLMEDPQVKRSSTFRMRLAYNVFEDIS